MSAPWVRRRRTPAAALLVGLAGYLAFSCIERIDVGSLRAEAGLGGLSGAAGQSFAGASGELSGGQGGSAGRDEGPECEKRSCLGKYYACGNCEDDDGDGLIDSEDPECVGACDDSERTFEGAIPGQNNAPCRQDCYFDADSGAGRDGCVWSHVCDPLSVDPHFGPSADARCAYDAAGTVGAAACGDLLSEQSAECLEFCGPLIPNGCDCFGCCELPAASGRYVWLGSVGCDSATLDDPEICRPCTPVGACLNSCDPCEDCVGRQGPAPECGNEADQCEGGQVACGRPGQAACPTTSYCVTGCCVPVPR